MSGQLFLSALWDYAQVFNYLSTPFTQFIHTILSYPQLRKLFLPTDLMLGQILNQGEMD
ncbi:MAG: hypothetical protein K2Q22_15315 [Cytophagales bacterium]|nr:hypothetical protein [Cytophagales bacterium]